MTSSQKFLRSFWAIILALVLLIGMIFALFTHHRAVEIGTDIGKANGRIVGTAVGSVKGFTEGMAKGEEDGKEAGRSAEDTTVSINQTLEAVGKLDVLAAKVSLKNINKIGDYYAGLYLISGNAVFSVDLNSVEVSKSETGNEIYVWIPEPELDLYLDESTTEKLAEIQHFNLTTNAEDGLKAYINSMKEIKGKAKESLINYDSLMEYAKSSAKSRIEQLVMTVCGDQSVVYVEFRGGNSNE